MANSHNSLCSPLFSLYSWNDEYFSLPQYNWQIRVPTLSSIESSLDAENYDRVLKEHLTHHYFGQQAKAQSLSLNQPFLLYNQYRNRYLIKEDIWRIDSNDKEMFFTREELQEPLVMHLEEGVKGLTKNSQHINTKTDYSLFTYFNHAKYSVEIDKELYKEMFIICRSTVNSYKIKRKYSQKCTNITVDEFHILNISAC